jgi:hypothetical protein
MASFPTSGGTLAQQHFRIDLVDDGLQQSLLVAEIVIEGAARQPGSRGEIVHRRGRIAFGREGLAAGRDELGPGVLDHLRARSRNHHHLRNQHTSRMLVDIRDVCYLYKHTGRISLPPRSVKYANP